MNNMTVIDECSLSFAKSFVDNTKEDLKSVKRSFFKIGFRLNEAVDQGYVEALGYADIFDLAYHCFGFESTTTKNLMAINRTYCVHEYMGHWLPYTMQMDERYDKYNQTQLVEMLPLADWQRKNVPEDFTAQELRDYKKIVLLKGEREREVLDVHGNGQIAEEPRKYVALYRQKKQEGAFDKPIVPVGQIEMTITEDDLEPVNVPPEDEEFHQSGAELYAQSQSTDQENISQSTDREIDSQSTDWRERMRAHAELAKTLAQEPKKHLFKNKQEREDFILNDDNYVITVLDCPELDITVKRLDFANGIKIYRTRWKSKSGNGEYVNGYTLHLVDESDRERPQTSAFCADYSCKHYTLTGTSLTYILEYMAKYKDEI